MFLREAARLYVSRRDDSYTPLGLGDPEGILPTKWFSAATSQDLHGFLGSELDLLVITVPLRCSTIVVPATFVVHLGDMAISHWAGGHIRSVLRLGNTRIVHRLAASERS